MRTAKECATVSASASFIAGRFSFAQTDKPGLLKYVNTDAGKEKCQF